MASNKMKPAVEIVPFVDAFSQTPEADGHKQQAAAQYLADLADQCDFVMLESDEFGARVARKVADGTISQETADLLAAEFGFPRDAASDEIESDEAVREYAGAVCALSDVLAECPESEIAEFLAML